MDNLAEQCEEIEALKAIYDNFKMEDDTNSFSMQICPNVDLFISLNEQYPSTAPPAFELLAPTLTAIQKQQVADEFRQIYENNLGGPVLFQWIEKLKEIVQDDSKLPEEINSGSCVESQEIAISKEVVSYEVTHGDIIQDRKSVFQGHAGKVHCIEDTKAFMDCLLENKKIAQATHNISAYRILTEKGTLLQDCDDDGETHAGGRVLHLLQILNLTDVMVVVSRWYGGIHLGPDRFKHINNATRQVLVQAGFLPS